MELFLPDQIGLNEASKALIGDVEETARRVHEYRPLPPDVVKRIEDSLLGDRVYSSNAIEGSTLDYRETVVVLKTGRILENKKQDSIEARNLGEADGRIDSLVSRGNDAHTVENLFVTHRLILRETADEYWGGRFREQGVNITGAMHQPPDHSIVPALVERVLERLKETDDQLGILTACWTHWALARIHPFKEGNGRIARLWQNLVLLQQNLTCAIIRPEERRAYFDALAAADEGDFNLLVQLTAQRVLTTFDKYLSEIARDKEFDAFVKEVTGATEARTGEVERLIYQRWARKMEQLRWEFELCATRITEASNNLRIQLQKSGVIDHEKWANIRLGLSSETPVFFALKVSVGKREKTYTFVFRKCDFFGAAERPDDMLYAVSLRGVEEPRGQRGLGNFDITTTTLVTSTSPSLSFGDVWLVEAVVGGDEFTVVRRDPDAQDLQSETPVSPLRVAQDFIRSVVLRRLT